MHHAMVTTDPQNTTFVLRSLYRIFNHPIRKVTNLLGFKIKQQFSKGARGNEVD
jgi:hypothetical protein